MPARSQRLGRTAAWGFSLAVHLLLLAGFILFPAKRLATPTRFDLTLLPPPPDYLRSDQARAEPDRAALPPALRARGRPDTVVATPSPILAVNSPPPQPGLAPTASPTTVASSQTAVTPGQGPRLPAGATGDSAGLDANALNALRQSFGCSSSQLKNLTPVERAACEARGAKRAEAVPDRPYATIPQYKREYYDQVRAAQQAPSHIPGTDCVLNLGLADQSSANYGAPRGGGGGIALSLDLKNPIRCVPLPGGGPKPKPPTLQELGLAR